MALTYEDFKTYPLEVAGIGELHNDKIKAIENFVVSDLAYTGESLDVTAVLPYFVYFYFAEDAAATMFAETGENVALKKYTITSINKRVRAWDIGAKLLKVICDEKETDAKAKYLKGMNFFI